MAADAGLPMGFQSIFAWKALPEAAFVKKAVIDAHRSKEESIASGWLHRSARPILPQASPVWKVRNLPHCCLRARESVRRASGFVQIPISLILSYKRGCQGKKLLPAPLRDAGVVTYIQPHLIPHLILRGVIGWSLWLAALPRGDANPSCLSQLDGFMKSVAHDAVRFRSYASLSVGLSANQDPI